MAAAEGVKPSITVEGDGPSVLFLHGGPGLSDYALMLADELEGWRCIHYQQRGLPPSSLEGPFTVEQHVDDALAVLEETRTPSVVLLGHSWGGMLALQVALQAPERVAAMVLVDPMGALGDGGTGHQSAMLQARLPESRRQQLDELRSDSRRQDNPDAAALAELRLYFPSYFADPRSAPPLPDFFRLSVTSHAETMDSVMPEIADGSLAKRLSSLEMPTVVLVGAKSPLPNDAGNGIAERIGGAELVVVEDAGHLPWVEQPGCVRAALERIAPVER